MLVPPPKTASKQHFDRVTRGEVYTTPEEAATRLRISTYTILKWARHRKVPHMRIGRCVRFDIPTLMKANIKGRF